jgi:hypothetical protein
VGRIEIDDVAATVQRLSAAALPAMAISPRCRSGARQLPARGVSSRRIPVDTSGLRSFRGAFVTNARGIAPVGQVDDVSLPVDGTMLATLTQAYESAGWDLI